MPQGDIQFATILTDVWNKDSEGRGKHGRENSKEGKSRGEKLERYVWIGEGEKVGATCLTAGSCLIQLWKVRDIKKFFELE